jgi:two-component system, cell cycle sensor histidine kinase and response regulator CckA
MISDLSNAADHLFTGSTALLVDDEHPVRRVVAEHLLQMGFAVSEAPDGDAAISWLDQQSAAPDLMVVDLVMPGMGGLELAAAARKRFPEVRILFMSGFADDLVILQERLNERTSFIPKPFDRATLKKRVSALIGG